jgi:hypothetical protein
LKLLIVLAVLGVIFLLIYLRLRPYIRMARQMFGFARGMGRAAGQASASSPAARGAGDRLVRCAACETWIPASRALQLRSSKAAYCSTDCLEGRAEGGRRKAAS